METEYMHICHICPGSCKEKWCMQIYIYLSEIQARIRQTGLLVPMNSKQLLEPIRRMKRLYRCTNDTNI